MIINKDEMKAFDAEKAREVLERVHKFLGILIRENLVKDAPFLDEGELENESDLADDVWEVLQGIDGMTFGMAIEAMKQGKKVARKGWNGKGMYLWILPAASVKAEWCKEPHLKTLAEQNGGEVECLGSVRMKTADGKVLTGWLASQTDMLSDDWQIVD